LAANAALAAAVAGTAGAVDTPGAIDTPAAASNASTTSPPATPAMLVPASQPAGEAVVAATAVILEPTPSELGSNGGDGPIDGRELTLETLNKFEKTRPLSDVKEVRVLHRLVQACFKTDTIHHPLQPEPLLTYLVSCSSYR